MSRKTFALAVVVILIALSAYTAYDLNGSSLDFRDRQVVLIVTDSMDGDVHGYDVDSYPANTLAVIQNIPEHEVRFIRVGQVAAYQSGDMLITHRVVAVNTENSCLLVKGDNSSKEESVGFDDVVGVVVGTNHVLGAPISFIKENMQMLLICVALIVGGIAAIYAFRHLPEERKKSIHKGAAFSVAIVAVVGLAFVGAGYAYTASTENSDNTVQSEYVVLSMSNYTFSADASFSYHSLTGSDGKTVYYITGSSENETPVQILDKDDGTYSNFSSSNKKYYCGILIGEPSTLHVDASHYNVQDPSPRMTIEVGMDDTDNLRFTKYQPATDEWTYFLKMYYVDDNGTPENTADDTQKDKHWLWSKGNGWNNLIGNGVAHDGKWVNVVIDLSKDYVVELYFGGPKTDIPGYSYSLPASAVEPLGKLTYKEGGVTKYRDPKMIVYDGYVSFTFNSDNNPIIIFDKNSNSATGTMNALEMSATTPKALSKNNFKLTGKTFSGWNTEPDGTGTGYSDEESITATQNMILYAQWSP